MRKIDSTFHLVLNINLVMLFLSPYTIGKITFSLFLSIFHGVLAINGVTLKPNITPIMKYYLRMRRLF